MKHIGADEATYVMAIVTLYGSLPDTPLRPSLTDLAVARKLCQDEVPFPVVESALLLASLRRLARASDLPPLPRVRSLAYFLPVIAELQQQPLPDGYLDHLRLKLHKLSQVHRQVVQKSTFSNDR